jgi:deoxyribonuclease V
MALNPSPFSHPWNVPPQEAIAIQQRLRSQVICQDRFDSLHHLAGVDVGFEENGATTRAAVVVLALPDLEIVESALARRPTSFPYVPGLLSFREAPAALEALEMLHILPDMLLCDGHGLAHPRRFGIACHLGVLTGLPAIGVAKSLLVGSHAPPAQERGAWQPLIDAGELIGAALRTRPGAKPIIVSTGHRVSLESALRIVLTCTGRYRLPETTRQAHHLASNLKA